jgi:hypothetical protein
LGLRKGSCPITDESIAMGVEAARNKLAAAAERAV